MILTNKSLLAALVGVVLVIAVPAAQADDDEDEGQRAAVSRAKVSMAKSSNPKWASECGACHLAYPARFLPAESWREMMSGLDKHFGSDASMDAESAREITAFLEQNARRKPTSRDASGKLPLRITETQWFRNEHDEVSSRVWKSPKVKSAANCSACHLQADLGDYSEHNVEIPR